LTPNVISSIIQNRSKRPQIEKEEMMFKSILGIILSIAGVLGGLYVGLWLMFIQPIIYACSMFDGGKLTATIIGITIVKCVLASFVGVVIGSIGVGCGMMLIAD
jgi:hypothetical protein